ncbi:hypothetical protein CCP3SC15_4640002 [Gammaproteobacteria bacterium]
MEQATHLLATAREVEEVVAKGRAAYDNRPTVRDVLQIGRRVKPARCKPFNPRRRA